MHYLPCCGIDLVRSLVPELNRQPKIFNHEHVPHLRISTLSSWSRWFWTCLPTNRPYFLNKPSSDTTLSGIDSLLCTRPQPSSRFMHRKQKWTKEERTHRILTWKPKCGKKPRQHTECRMITMREENSNGESTEATTFCTPSSPHGGYNGGNDLFLSLSLSLTFYTVSTLFT